MRASTISWLGRSAALGLVLGAVTVAPALGTFAVDCTYDPDTHTVILNISEAGPEAGAFVTMFRSGDNITANGSDCQSDSMQVATVKDTDTIRVNGASGTQQFGISLDGGPFAPGYTDEPGGSDEIEFVLDLKGGYDIVLFAGSSSADRFRFGVKDSGPRINLNANETDGVDADVRVKRTETTNGYGLGSGDVLSGIGGKGTGSEATYGLLLYGGIGNDRLIGGSAHDVLNDDMSSTGDTDVLKGRGGGDSLDATDGDALDSLYGGSGTDSCVSDDGDVVVDCEPV
jgi:hypothetical protein